jgi:hypothetical protein
VVLDRTARAIEKQASWKQGYCPWDISNAPLRRWLLVSIGIDALVAKLRAGWCWCKYDLKPYADRARALAPQIKVALHFTIKDSMSDTQVIHQLLAQLGIKLSMHWSRSVVGYVGEKLRTYVLDQAHWSQMNAVLERREAKRQRLQERGSEGVVSGSPVSFAVVKVGGDPAATETAGRMSGLSRHTGKKVQHGLESLIQIELQSLCRSEAQSRDCCWEGSSAKL